MEHLGWLGIWHCLESVLKLVYIEIWGRWKMDILIWGLHKQIFNLGLLLMLMINDELSFIYEEVFNLDNL